MSAPDRREVVSSPHKMTPPEAFVKTMVANGVTMCKREPGDPSRRDGLATTVRFFDRCEDQV